MASKRRRPPQGLPPSDLYTSVLPLHYLQQLISYLPSGHQRHCCERIDRCWRDLTNHYLVVELTVSCRDLPVVNDPMLAVVSPSSMLQEQASASHTGQYSAEMVMETSYNSMGKVEHEHEPHPEPNATSWVLMFLAWSGWQSSARQSTLR